VTMPTLPPSTRTSMFS